MSSLVILQLKCPALRLGKGDRGMKLLGIVRMTFQWKDQAVLGLQLGLFDVLVQVADPFKL